MNDQYIALREAYNALDVVNAELRKTIKKLKTKNAALTKQVADAQSQTAALAQERERLRRKLDAAVEDILCDDHCDVCAHKNSGTSCERVEFECGECDDPACICRCCRDENKWQWRGAVEL
jgi:FtsZ-binding cell division protein ZapB